MFCTDGALDDATPTPWLLYTTSYMWPTEALTVDALHHFRQAEAGVRILLGRETEPHFVNKPCSA